MGFPKWWDNRLKQQNQRSQQQEQKIAKRSGGQRQAGSGSSWRRPQDVVEETHLVQAKYTDATSATIKVKEWLGLRRDARNAGRDPAMEIDFEKHKVRLIVIEIPYE